MHSARPSEREQGEHARIEAALDADDSDGFFHVGVGDIDDTLGRGEDGFADPGGQPADGFAAALRIDSHPSAEEEIRIDAPENEIGVGDRRFSAPAVAGRSGVGPGALRTDPQGAAFVQVGDRPPACADE